MKKRDQEHLAIAQSLMSWQSTAECACGVKETLEADDPYEAAEGFYDSGWRVSLMDELLCKRCVRKARKVK